MAYNSPKQRNNLILQFTCAIVLYVLCAVMIFRQNAMETYTLIHTWSPFFQTPMAEMLGDILTLLLLFINSVILKTYLTNNNLIELRDYRVVNYYLLFSFAFPYTLNIVALLFEVCFLYFMFPKLLVVGNTERSPNNFIYGFICGMISIVYHPFIFVMLLIYVSYLVDRSVNAKKIIMPILGFLLAFVYYFAFLYLTNQGMKETVSAYFSNYFSAYHVALERISGLLVTISFALILMMLFIKLYGHMRLVSSNINKRKKYFMIFFTCLYICVISMFLINANFYLTAILVISASLLIGLTLTFYNKRSVINMISVAFFLIVLYNNFAI